MLILKLFKTIAFKLRHKEHGGILDDNVTVIDKLLTFVKAVSSYLNLVHFSLFVLNFIVISILPQESTFSEHILYVLSYIQNILKQFPSLFFKSRNLE